MEITGKIKVIFDEKELKGGFTKREFVLSTEDQYPQHLMFELLKDKTTLVNGFKSGDKVKVLFDIRGREWQDKYFNSLVAWKIENLGAAANAPMGGNDMPPPPSPIDTITDPIEDDLPF